MDFDTLILNGTVVDGTGGARYPADVGVAGGKIVAIGTLADSEAGRTIDATGHVVAPGFIDMHSHSDVTMLDDPGGESMAYQGVTSMVTGNCGSSPYPSGLFSGPVFRRKLRLQPLPVSPTEWNWTTLDGWADHLESFGIPINVIPQVGNLALKYAAGADTTRPATEEELVLMRKMAAEAVEQGAVAVTTMLTGLSFTTVPMEEVVALVEAVAPYEKAFYSSHARIASGYHFKSLEETVEVGRRTGVPVNYSHIAILDSRHHGRADEMVAIIERARDEGVDATYDVVPSRFAAVVLRSLPPPWVEEGSADATRARLRDPETRARARKEMEKGWWGDIPWDWEAITITKVGADGDPDLLRRSLADIATARKADPLDTLLDLVEKDNDIEAVMENRDEGDLRYFLTHPLGMIGSDGTAISPHGIWADIKPHPRCYGAFPRVLGHYVREEKVLSLETAVHKISGRPAERAGLRDRGRIAEGLAADLVVFDPETVIDTATFDDPHQYPEGIPHVFVNGEALVANGKHTGARSGRVLRREA